MNDFRKTEPAISVIIPVYNKEPVLRRTLDSVRNQTFRDLEMICIDDASTDGSADILREYAGSDPRIRLIEHPRNRSTSQARKDGVLASMGKYIMFLDGDDTLTADACEKTYAAIEASHTDMVQFGTDIINCAGVPQTRIESNRRQLEPYIGKVEGENLIHACWNEKKFGFQLWNKIYNGEICRRAFMQVEDGSFPKAQDLYAFFLIAYYSRTYEGIPDRLYRYSFGLGVTGGNRMTMERYDILLTQRRVWEAIERFCRKQGASELSGTAEQIGKSLFYECADRWMNQLYPQDLPEGFRKLTQCWGMEKSICLLAEKYWWNHASVLEKLAESDAFGGKRKRSDGVLTIAVYYRSIVNGGAQRVTAQVCSLLADRMNAEGEPLYRVILITDTQEQEHEYPISGRVLREYLPAYDVYIGEKYRERYRAWNRILSEYAIDAVITGMWISLCTVWDMLTVKNHPSHPAFIIHSHNFSAVPYRYDNDAALRMILLYQLCDGSAVLSECDQAFVGKFCRNVRYIPNPFGYLEDGNASESSRTENTIVWIGRISKEKQPMDLIYMMEAVTAVVPTARLKIVGDGDVQLEAQMRQAASNLGLDEAISFEGFTADVEKYYRDASVFVCTSEYEGFPMAIGESLFSGLPVVMYDLPWLTFVKEKKGVITVPQGRFDLLAQAAVRVMTDPETARRLQEEGKELMRRMRDLDAAQVWVELIDNALHVPDDTDSAADQSDERILFEYITRWQQEAKGDVAATKNKLQQAYAEKSGLNRKLQQAYAEKSGLNRKLQQTYAEKSKINQKLQQTYAEKSELNRKLQQTYAEKSEISRKLQAVSEEAERIKNSRSYRFGRMLTAPLRWLRQKRKG